MSVVSLLEQARDAGLVFTMDGERLVVRGPQHAEELARAALARKPEVVVALQLESAAGERADGSATQSLNEWIECFGERAAIIEFDGNLPRQEAEHLAMAATIEAIAASRGGARG